MTAPKYVSTPWNVGGFDPYPGGPTIPAQPSSAFIADQTTLDDVVAAAQASGINLILADTGPTPPPNPLPVDPFIRWDQPQPELSEAQRQQARENIGSLADPSNALLKPLVFAAGGYLQAGPTESDPPVWVAAPSVASAFGWVIATDAAYAGGMATANSAADNDAALDAAIAAAARNVVFIPSGTYDISAHHLVVDGVDLRGSGGGSTSRQGATTLRCTAAAAQIEVAGGGGLCQGFEIDGNSIANTPFKRSAGAGANARSFHNITVHHNAGATSDCIQFIAAQNDHWLQCGFGYASRDLAVFNAGYGGATFERCEWTGSIGRYTHRFDNDVTIVGQQYPQPANIVFLGTNIGEGAVSQAHVKINAGQDIVYDKFWFFTLSASAGPAIDITPNVGVTVTGIELRSPKFQSSPTTKTTGTKAISLTGNATIAISGYAWYFNFDKPINIDTISPKIEDKSFAQFFNCTNTSPNGYFYGTNGATRFQWENLTQGPLLATVPPADTSPASAVMVGYNAARTGLLYQLLADGTLTWFNNNFGGFDAAFGRIAANVIGVKPGGGQHFVIATGGGTTAQRDALAVPSGTIAMWGNTQTGTFDWWDGTAWHQLSTGGGGGGSGAADLPSYVSTAAHAWSAARSSYNENPSVLHGQRAANMKVREGSADSHIAATGDSMGIGYDGTGYDFEHCTIRTVGKELARAYQLNFCNGIQMLIGDTANRTADNVTKNTLTASAADQALKSTANGQNGTWQALDPSPAVQCFYWDDSPSGFSFSIDGVAQSAITTGGTNTIKSVTYTGLANKKHLVQFNSSAAGQKWVAVWPKNTAIKQVYAHNFSIGGATCASGSASQKITDTTSTLGGPYGLGYCLAQIVAEAGITLNAVLCSIGGNDILGSVTPAATQTGMHTFFGASWLPTAKTYLHTYKPAAATSDGTWDTFSTNVYAEADLSNVSIFDLDHYVNRRASASADGLIGADGTHPLSVLQRSIGRCVADMWKVGLPAQDEDVVLIEVSGAYPPRPSTAVVPPGKAHYIGHGASTDMVDPDRWTQTP